MMRRRRKERVTEEDIVRITSDHTLRINPTHFHLLRN